MNNKDFDEIFGNSVPSYEMLIKSGKRQAFLDVGDEQVAILPVLHFLYYRQEGPSGEEGVGMACLELGLFSWGKDAEEAENSIFFASDDYFRQRLKKITTEEIEKIIDDIKSDMMEPYWALLRMQNLLEAASGYVSRELQMHQELAAYEGVEKTLKRENKELREENQVLLLEKERLELELRALRSRDKRKVLSFGDFVTKASVAHKVGRHVYS